MKLNVHQIRRFFGNTSGIKGNGIMPVLEYIKIDNDRIIKTNLQVWVSMEITPVNGAILINEAILSNLVKKTTSDTIEVLVKGDKVTLSDGTNKPTFLLSPHEHYPSFPDSEKEGEVTLSEEVLEAIGIASKNTATNDVRPAFNHVNLAHGYVAASDSFRVYLKQFDTLPTILINPLAAGIISQFAEVKYYARGTYNFFEVGSSLFGFAQSEGKPVDLSKYIQDTQKDTYMEVFCHEIYNFIELFMAFSGSDEVPIEFNDDKLSFYDVDREVSNEVILSTEGEYKPKVNFLPRLVNSLLRSLGKDKIKISPLKTAPAVLLWHEDDPSTYAFLPIISK